MSIPLLITGQIAHVFPRQWTSFLFYQASRSATLAHYLIGGWKLILPCLLVASTSWGQSFSPQATFPVGTSPQSVVIWDVNKDTKQDIVTANTGGNNVSVLLNQQPRPQPIRYVKAGATGDGSSWATASGDLQAMINAEGVEQVWVAAGTYKPTSTTDRSISFVVINNVQVLGGFPVSGDPDLSQRSPESFTTILSGDIGTEGDPGDNAFHVVQFQNASSQTRLDGFVITGGNASGFTSPTGYGGAIFNDGSEGGNSIPTLANLQLIANTATLGGGGLYNNGLGGNCSPVLTNVRFIGNSTPYEGGAMHTIGNCSPVLTNVEFSGNSAESGGGMFNKAYQTTCRFVLTNVSFLNNFAYVQGGAMYNTANQANCQYQLTNVSLLGNSAPYDGGAIVSIDVSLTISNGVVFGNKGSATLVNYNSPVTAHSSLFDTGVTDYIDGGNNQTTTVFPFVSATDIRLKPCSPAINAGDNAAYTTANGPATDPAGNPRLFDNGSGTPTTIDMGAYEYQGDPVRLMVTNPVVSSATVGQGFLAAFTATGGSDPYTYRVVSSNLPSSLSLSTAGVPDRTPTEVGSYTLLVEAGDANGCVGLAAIAFSLTVNTAAPPCGSVVYVTQDGAGTQNGSSWSNAFAGTALQTAINTAAGCGAQVWVAAGTYKPTTTTDRTISFAMKNGVSILGGFPASGDPDLTQRNPASYTTTLSGDIGTIGDNTDNSYHVINNNNVYLLSTAVLDGFVITLGNANDASVEHRRGGGLQLQGTPVILNCQIRANSAMEGGGLFIAENSPLLINCTLIGNTSTSIGGGIFCTGAYPRLINCTLSGNHCDGLGSAISFISSIGIRPRLTNCLVWNNEGQNAFSGGTLTANYSLIEPGETGYSGSNNLTADPQFIDAAAGDYRLRATSPAINAGNSLSYTAAGGPFTDLAGNVRIKNGTIDIGAYETGLPTDLTPVVYARTISAGGTTTVSLVVDVFEINTAPTTQPVTVRITKDAKVALSFDNNITSVGGRPVQNSVWSFDAAQPGYYQVSTTQPLLAGDIRSFGLTGVLTPGGTVGIVSLSATVEGGGEVNLENNTDADKIEYFQQ